MSTCRFCDQPLSSEADKCPNCGAPVDERRTLSPDDLDREVKSLMEEHRTLDAVNLYREQTGVGVPEAKKAVEAIAGVQEIDVELQAALLELLGRDEKIQAIRLYKERTGANLANAKRVVEAFAARHGLPQRRAGCAGMLAVFLLICSPSSSFWRPSRRRPAPMISSHW